MSEMGDKLPADDKAAIEERINALKEALKGDNLDEIRNKMNDVQAKFADLAQKAQAAAQAAGAAGAQPGAEPPKNDDGYVDADYRSVDNN